MKPAWLISAAAGLCAVIAFEVTGGPARPDDAPMAMVPPGAPARASMQPDTPVQEILARPLFSPDRRPAAASARSVSGLPRLSAILLADARKTAIFSVAGGKPIVAEEGARIGVYEVRTITDSGVTVAGPDGTTVLRPVFDSASSAAVVAPIQALPMRAPPPRPPVK